MGLSKRTNLHWIMEHFGRPYRYDQRFNLSDAKSYVWFFASIEAAWMEFLRTALLSSFVLSARDWSLYIAVQPRNAKSLAIYPCIVARSF